MRENIPNLPGVGPENKVAFPPLDNPSKPDLKVVFFEDDDEEGTGATAEPGSSPNDSGTAAKPPSIAAAA